MNVSSGEGGYFYERVNLEYSPHIQWAIYMAAWLTEPDGVHRTARGPTHTALTDSVLNKLSYCSEAIHGFLSEEESDLFKWVVEYLVHLTPDDRRGGVAAALFGDSALGIPGIGEAVGALSIVEDVYGVYLVIDKGNGPQVDQIEVAGSDLHKPVYGETTQVRIERQRREG